MKSNLEKELSSMNDVLELKYQNLKIELFISGTYNYLQQITMKLIDIPKLKSQLSSKIPTFEKENIDTKIVYHYFLNSYSTYQKLFQCINDQNAYYIKSEPLRHPLIFYFGHTATFYINKLVDSSIIKHGIDQKLQSCLAVGVDQMDWDDLDQTHYEWPSLKQVKEYRAKAKQIILNAIEAISDKINWNSEIWAILMGIEHQRIHLQTSSVIIRRLPIQYITPSNEFIDCPIMETQLNKIPKNSFAKWPKQIKNTNVYGWDNEFGKKEIHLKQFEASQMLVSNGEYYQFIQDNGYQNMNYWSEEGKAWIKSSQTQQPIFWVRQSKQKLKLRTMNKIIDMPWDWPAQVNNLQAQAFCSWKSQKTGLNIRLPTEDEYYALRAILKEDQPTWKYQSVGNINLQYWFSPSPVNMFKTRNFYDIVGNVWQHTLTPIYPFDNFDVHPLFDDFTTPTLDNRHSLIKGGSFVSTGDESLMHSRYAFRRHFYQFAGFRYVISNNSIILSNNIEQTDAKVQECLKMHYLNDKTYIAKVNQIIKTIIVAQNCKINKAITVGCSVGRIPFQLSRYANQSYGIDYIARYFQMATKLSENGFVKYKTAEIYLNNLGLKEKSVKIYQFNPERLDSKKLFGFDFIFVDGYNLKKNTLMNVIEKMNYISTTSYMLIVLQVKGYNQFNGQKHSKLSMWQNLNEIRVECQTCGEFKLHVYKVTK